ncbi:MAG: sulfur oxidation c-type cytochrome SoxX [Hyphomicrobiaceae bacterium]|nr:sulfur oxidation c-type cytochrome SoxX [Hyphomicrobiaceae bacterium]
MRNVTLVTLLGLGLAAVTVAIAGETRPVGERQLRRTLRLAFPEANPQWAARLVPDQTMATCATWKNQPPKEVADEIKRRERATLRYPQDGDFVGDWRRGERIAQSGYGLRFTDNDSKRQNGGNCYACHQLAPEEVSFGTIGVALKGYGKLHKPGAADARIVYEKIYNSQAVVACSLMPRFGANGILTVEQIKDLVALLIDPESPVNK